MQALIILLSANQVSSMEIILSRIQGLQKCTLLIIIILLTISLLSKRSAAIMLIQTACNSIGAAAVQQLNHQKPQGYSSSTASTLIPNIDQCDSSITMQQEKRMLIHGDAQRLDGVRDYIREEKMKKVRTLRKRIGSRPPMCRNKCETCFPCEAVKMVPTPTISSSAMQNIAHLDYSNYNPEGWKCKCGARIFNP